MLLPVLVGLCFGMLFSLMLVVPYVVYRYSYQPWLVVRKDIIALKDLRDQDMQWIKGEIGLGKARNISDEELARMEAVQRRQKVWGDLGKISA